MELASSNAMNDTYLIGTFDLGGIITYKMGECAIICFFHIEKWWMDSRYTLDSITRRVFSGKIIIRNSFHSKFQFLNYARCLKIKEKVSFNVANVASYVDILSWQKFIKNAKNGTIWRFFENLKLSVKQRYQIGLFEWDKN